MQINYTEEYFRLENPLPNNSEILQNDYDSLLFTPELETSNILTFKRAVAKTVTQASKAELIIDNIALLSTQNDLTNQLPLKLNFQGKREIELTGEIQSVEKYRYPKEPSIYNTAFNGNYVTRPDKTIALYTLIDMDRLYEAVFQNNKIYVYWRNTTNNYFISVLGETGNILNTAPVTVNTTLIFGQTHVWYFNPVGDVYLLGVGVVLETSDTTDAITFKDVLVTVNLDGDLSIFNGNKLIKRVEDAYPPGTVLDFDTYDLNTFYSTSYDGDEVTVTSYKIDTGILTTIRSYDTFFTPQSLAAYSADIFYLIGEHAVGDDTPITKLNINGDVETFTLPSQKAGSNYYKRFRNAIYYISTEDKLVTFYLGQDKVVTIDRPSMLPPGVTMHINRDEIQAGQLLNNKVVLTRLINDRQDSQTIYKINQSYDERAFPIHPNDEEVTFTINLPNEEGVEELELIKLIVDFRIRYSKDQIKKERPTKVGETQLRNKRKKWNRIYNEMKQYDLDYDKRSATDLMKNYITL